MSLLFVMIARGAGDHPGAVDSKHGGQHKGKESHEDRYRI